MSASSLGRLGLLPPELRNMIYKFVLVNDDVLDIRNYLYKQHSYFSTPSLTTNPLLNTIRPGIMHSSQQIREETLSIYYSQDFIIRMGCRAEALKLAKYIQNQPVSFLKKVKHLSIFVQDPWIEHSSPRYNELSQLLEALSNARFTDDRVRWIVGTQYPLPSFETMVYDHVVDVLSYIFSNKQDNIARRLVLNSNDASGKTSPSQD